MTNDASQPDGEFPGADESAFRALVDAAFGDTPMGSSAPEDLRHFAEIHAILSALGESALDAPAPALRERVLALFQERSPLVERWLLEAQRFVMELISPPPTHALAGFRVAEVPVRTFRTRSGAGLDAWVDLQIDRETKSVDGRRLRGQVTVDDGPLPIAIHAINSLSGRLLESAPIEDDGAFVMRLDAPQVDLLVELGEGGGALALPAIILRQ